MTGIQNYHDILRIEVQNFNFQNEVDGLTSGNAPGCMVLLGVFNFWTWCCLKFLSGGGAQRGSATSSGNWVRTDWVGYNIYRPPHTPPKGVLTERSVSAYRSVGRSPVNEYSLTAYRTVGLARFLLGKKYANQVGTIFAGQKPCQKEWHDSCKAKGVPGKLA